MALPNTAPTVVCIGLELKAIFHTEYCIKIGNEYRLDGVESAYLYHECSDESRKNETYITMEPTTIFLVERFTIAKRCEA
jgi:hypothetical protein